MKKPSTIFPHIALVRDFFATSLADVRKDAVRSLARAYPQWPEAHGLEERTPPPAHPDHWLDMEYAFCRIFLGPGAVPAPLYASVYLGNDGLLMGPVTLRVRALMYSVGLTVPREGHIPDDFLPYELDLYLALNAQAATPPASPQEAQERHWFLHEHLPRWLPSFIGKARPEAAECPAIRLVLRVLEKFTAERCNLSAASFNTESPPKL